MKKIKLLIIFILILGMSFNTGCMTMRRRKGNSKRENTEENTDIELDEIQKKIKSMTLDEKIGQLIIIGFEGLEFDESLEKKIYDLKPGGLILFRRNVEDSNQIVNLLNDIKTSNAKNKVPMFISTDEEGGSVTRMPKDIKANPSAKELGMLSDQNLTREFSAHMGKTLFELGINTNNAPVLDIKYNPNNEITKTRAFCKDAEQVSKSGLYFLNGLKDENILAVAKHFPGHGSTDVDSHYNLPIVNKKYDELMKEDIFPFKTAIDNGVDGIMVGHIMYKDLDKKYPASLSKKIITELLIEKLGYENLIFSDDMTMGAITNTQEPENAAIEFLEAGGDVALLCHGDNIGYEFKLKLKKELEEGRILEEEIDKKVYKILKIKEKYNMNNDLFKAPNTKKINKEYDELMNEKEYIKKNQYIEKMGD